MCYSEQNKETYLTKNECEKINAGYVHLSDGQKISTIAQPGETIVLYAQWGTDFYINFRGENNSSKNSKENKDEQNDTSHEALLIVINRFKEEF